MDDDKFSYKSKNIGGKYTPSVKGSEPSNCPKGFNNKIQFKHIFPNHIHQKNPNLSSKNS
jgi:hypothetical protein